MMVGPTKCENLHNVIMHNVNWAYQKTDLFCITGSFHRQHFIIIISRICESLRHQFEHSVDILIDSLLKEQHDLMS